jgi:penicillin-binding protein 2
MTTATNPRARFEAWRMGVVYIVALVVFGLLAFRLFFLQVIIGDSWKDLAVENYTRDVSVPAPRGIIYDRNGYVLARNIASYNLIITPAYLPDDEADIQRIYREISSLIDVPVGGPVTEESLEEAKKYGICVLGPPIADLVALGNSIAPYSPVKIKCNIGEEMARLVRERSMDWPGVSIEVEPTRDYPTGSLTATVVGFLGPIPAAFEREYVERGFVANRDKIGYAGVELSLDDILTGQNGKRVVEVDVAGKELRNLRPPVAAVPGNNVRLTLDTRMQAATEAALMAEINFWNTYFNTVRISSGVVIAANPRTGEILAMVQYPTFENNRMARFIPAYYYEQLSQDPRSPLLNNAISGEYPPGSVFKLTTATGALNEGVVTPQTIIETPGKIDLTEKFTPNDPGRERPFVDWIYSRGGVINEAGFGRLDFLRCIAYSSNVCFYKVGGGYSKATGAPFDEIKEGLGIFRLGEYARALGYGAVSGIELPGETDGLIPSPQWKRINTGENWSTGDTYIASVGQGYVIATPLQVLMSGMTLANDGKLMQPTIVREVVDGEGRIVQPFTPRLKWDITSDPLIQNYSCDAGYCDQTGETKVVRPEVVRQLQSGMRQAVTDPTGTLHSLFADYQIAVAGKTGSAEYCDDVALAQNRCQFGSWPVHAWTMAYAPYDNPEIIVVAFAYNGGEGASVAGPIVWRVIRAYFELKSADIAQ